MQSHCERCVWGCILVQASGRSWLLRTVLRPRWDLEVPIRSSPVLCRGTAWGCCPSPHGRALCAGRPVYQERGAGCTVCAAEANAAECARLAAAEAGLRGDGGTLLLLLPWRPRDCPVCCRTQRPLLEGRRHRGTGQPASLRRSRRPERHRSSTSRRPRSAALVEMLHPYEKELQQPVESCPCDALDNPAPCCLEGPEKACRRALETQAHSTVHGRAQHSALEAFTRRVTPCLYI